MACAQHILFGAVIMVTMCLPAVYSHECDCSKYTKGGDGCDQYTAAVRNCIGPNTGLPRGKIDIPTVCRIYNETATCMATVPQCDNPPADSKTWTDIWAAMDNMAGPICSHSPDDTSCGNFESQALTCMMPIMNGGGPDMEKLCGLIKDAESCMDPLVSRCPTEALSSNINQAYQTMKQQMENIPCEN